MVSSRTRAVFLNPNTAGPPPQENMVLVQGIGHAKNEYMTPEDAAKHITIWNCDEGRKIAGNAAPLRKNLASYLSKHPECEVYRGQDQEIKKSGGIDPRTGKKVVLMNEHIPIWHRKEGRKVTGNAAPLKKNLEKYLKKHPECEVYNHQDRFPERAALARKRESKKGKTRQDNTENTNGIPKPGPIAGFSNAKRVFRDGGDGDHAHEGGNYVNFSKPVVAIVSSPSDGTTFGMPTSPMGDERTYNRLDYKGAFGMYRKPDAAYAEPSWQDMSRSWSNTPAWQVMASRSEIAGMGASQPFSPAQKTRDTDMADHQQAPITPTDQPTLADMASPRSLLLSPKNDVAMGSSLSSSPGSTPLSPDVPMMGPNCLLNPSMAMECSPTDGAAMDMAFSPSHFLVSGSGFSLGRM